MKIFLILLFIIALGLPLLSFAAVCSAGTCETVADCDADFECIEDRCIGENNLNLCYPSFSGLNLALDTELTEVIAWFYYGIVAISGLAAFVMIVWGGIQWMSSAGNPGATTDAKDKLRSAMLGLLLILSSFIILWTINPELTTLQIPGLAPVECARDVDGNCLTSVPPEVTNELLMVNGGLAASVQPGEEFKLAWMARNIMCNPSSQPEVEGWQGSWNKERTNTGMESISLSQEETYTFGLVCGAKVGTVNVNVSSLAGSKPAGSFSIDLKADNNDGPITWDNSSSILFTWEQQGFSDDDLCILNDLEGPHLFPNVSKGEAGISVSPVALISVGRTETFLLTCSGSGGTASDTVLICIEPTDDTRCQAQ